METRDIVLVALFAALTASLAIFPPLTVPAVGVPITAQSIGPMLAGGVLGARRGGLAMALFVLLVLAGLPLLAGGRGGIGVFMSPSAGFILGWVAAAAATGFILERRLLGGGFLGAFLATTIGGIVVLYAIGVPVVAVIADIPLRTALMGSAVFIPGDLVKAGAAGAIILALRRAYPSVSPGARRF